jgi:hypothetical protein
MQHRSYEWLARSGYAAEGCVYVIMGGLAVLAALGAGGRTTGAKGALLALLSQPFGFALLGLVAFGLLCLSGWRIAQSILDADRLGNEGSALVRRIGYGVSGAVDAGFAFFAISVSSGSRLPGAVTSNPRTTGPHICSERHLVDGLWEQSGWGSWQQASE